MSNYESVKQFTIATKGNDAVPKTPKAMSKEKVVWLVKMVCSEMAELLDTVTDSTEETQKLMEECIHTDPSKHVPMVTEYQKVAAQADAMVDAWYYMCNAASMHGIDVSTVFDMVHDANMRKLVNGKAILREDGKVLKPAGWKPADIDGYFSQVMS